MDTSCDAAPRRERNRPGRNNVPQRAGKVKPAGQKIPARVKAEALAAMQPGRAEGKP